VSELVKVDDTATALLYEPFLQNLLGKRTWFGTTDAEGGALAEAKRWLRELPAEEVLKLTAAATDGVVRGDRGKFTLELPSRKRRTQSSFPRKMLNRFPTHDTGCIQY